MTPRQAIKQKCLECSAGNSYEARMCDIKNCPLWQFREQEKTRPKRKGRTAEDMAKIRLLKNSALINQDS